MTWIEVIDSAIKIGLGALIAASAGYLSLRKTHGHEIEKRKEERFYKNLDDRKSVYLEFSVQSHGLIHKYDHAWCDSASEDFKLYLTEFNKIQIICPDNVKTLATDVFNSVTTFITFNKSNLGFGDEELTKLHDNLRSKARLKLATFQKAAQLDVNQVCE